MIALFIILFGVLSIPKLPIARFPSVAPPQISITATYPGATPKTLNDSVVTLIEREMSGVKTYCITVQHQIIQEVQPSQPPLSLVQMLNLLKSMYKTKSKQLNQGCHSR